MKLKCYNFISFFKIFTIITLLQRSWSLESKLKNKQSDLILPLITPSSSFQPTIQTTLTTPSFAPTNVIVL